MTGRLEQLRAMAESGARPPVAELLGMELTAVDEGEATMRIEAGQEHQNTMGLVHGGILCDVADAAMGAAYASTLGTDESFTTVELDIKFLRPVREGPLEARAHVVKRGSTTGLVECDVVAVGGGDEDERLLARASCTCMVLREDRAEDRMVGENLADG